MEEILTSIKYWAALYWLNIVGAIIIVIVGRWVAKLLRKLIKKAMIKSKVDETISSFIGNLVYGLLLTIVIIVALGRLGVDTTSFAAVIAAAGLAIGFALQGTLSNFAAGVMILLFRQFKVGDYIEAGGTSGVVEEIHIFSTRIITVDNKVVYVPNSKLTGDNIINYTEKDTRRVDLVFGIGYSDDIDKARNVIDSILANDPKILKDPAPAILVSELGDSSVNFNVRPWTKTEHYWDVYFNTTESVKKKFDQEGISIPFPQRDVHMFQN